MGLDCFRKPFHNSVLPMDLETQNEEEILALCWERGKADMGKTNHPDKTIHKYQKNHTSSTVMKDMPPNTVADRETVYPDWASLTFGRGSGAGGALLGASAPVPWRAGSELSAL